MIHSIENGVYIQQNRAEKTCTQQTKTAWQGESGHAAHARMRLLMPCIIYTVYYKLYTTSPVAYIYYNIYIYMYYIACTIL